MGFKYCPDCDHWWATADYSVDESGQTICGQYPTHGATIGFIDKHMRTAEEFKREHSRSTYTDRDKMLKAAQRQGLIR